jgi:hypothetical protein
MQRIHDHNMDGCIRDRISEETADSYNYLRTQTDKASKHKNIIAGNLKNTG